MGYSVWVYKGRVKRLVRDESGRAFVVDGGPASGMWLLFQHGRAA